MEVEHHQTHGPRQTVMTDRRPCDAMIMAIVDQWEVAGEVKYHKGEEARTTQ